MKGVDIVFALREAVAFRVIATAPVIFRDSIYSSSAHSIAMPVVLGPTWEETIRFKVAS